MVDIEEINQKWRELHTYEYYLRESDWVIAKMMEADTEEERTQLRQKYADTISQRKQWRTQINQLEEQIKQME